MKVNSIIAQLSFYAGILTNISQASPSTPTSDITLAFVDNNIQPDCLECPNLLKSLKYKTVCGKKRILYLTDRTCFTCPKYKCVMAKYFKEGHGKVCPKILPTCNGRCKEHQTCFITVQTRYSCPVAKCIPRLLNRHVLEDYYISNQK